MRKQISLILLLCLLACAGCSKKKSTDQLIEDLKSEQEHDRVVAVRLLPERKADAEKVVPALIEALKDTEGDVRWGAAIGLGYFGEQANEAVAALQEAQQRDPDARVREAAGVALSRIDPSLAPKTAPAKARGK
jgi:HEAT repeat protein